MASSIVVIGTPGFESANNLKQCAVAEARAAIAQLGERQTEDLKVPGSIPGLGIIGAGHQHSYEGQNLHRVHVRMPSNVCL